MLEKIFLGIVLAAVFLPAAGAKAEEMFEPLGHEQGKLPIKKLGTVIAPNGIGIELTENDQGALDHHAPEIRTGAGPSKMQVGFRVRKLKTSERLYVITVVHGIAEGKARLFNQAVPRDKLGGYSHGDQIPLLRAELYEICKPSCFHIEELYAVFTPQAFDLYYAEDGLVLKMVSDDANFDIVRIPRDHIEAALAVADQS